MKNAKHSGYGIKVDDNQERASGITRGNLGNTRGVVASTDVRGDGAAAKSKPRTLQATTQMQAAVVPKDTDRTNGDLSQGKISDPDAITKYADAIGDHRRRGVDAFLEIGRLCAEADERLDPAPQAELQAKLPFSAATFSKFKKIGLDARLRKPEVQVLLPAAYTTLYSIACLKNEEDLSAAITDKIINPDMKRGELEKWWKEREAARQLKADAPDDSTGSPADPVSDAAGNNVNGTAEPSVSGEAPAPTVEAPLLVPPAPSEQMPTAGDVTTASPSLAPTGDENITSDVFSLSADDQADLDVLNTTWDRASDLVREQFRARIGA
jgi:hypothetical protein